MAKKLKVFSLKIHKDARIEKKPFEIKVLNIKKIIGKV